ncbi:MAG: DUF3604 domain-containing protein [Hyphomicrobiaceae bacterium]|nr:DUF3604 domain-containing protein [Hyphomicrobiaceae bacterium]
MEGSKVLLAGNLSDNIPAKLAGHATIEPSGEFEAGSYATIKLVYTAGFYGIDDSGSIKIVGRFATDQTTPQFDDPAAPGYTTVVASNNAKLEVRYDPKGNVRPWDATLYIKVVNGFMKEGDTITIVFGEQSGGSPGMRLQTFCEDTYEFRVLVDAIATYTYVPIPEQPTINIVPGPPETWRAVLPTTHPADKPFRLSLKGEDRWGNPSNQVSANLHLNATPAIAGLPETVSFAPGAFAHIVDGLTATEPGVYWIDVTDDAGTPLCRSNPVRIVTPQDGQKLHFWGDVHGQSEETIGTNSARQYMEFARDKAFIDVIGHQGNDFQITKEFWADLNTLMGEFNEPGRFVTLPGYEWSGNTFLGGDRNVFYMTEDRPIYRSSHALVDDMSDVDTDCGTAAALFEKLIENDEDAVCLAHCGGRYADVKVAHDGRVEKSVEVHSSWGTFEWILHDALEMGYRVGTVCNSDGHKGRPGASYPGSSKFGAIGGLTCFVTPELTRAGIFDCFRKRHHYGTTGNRMILDVTAEFAGDGTLYHDDPALGDAEGIPSSTAMMGDIVKLASGDATLKIHAVGSAPIERIDIFNGLEHVSTYRPYGESDLGRRIRVVWEGAEYRGRFRQVIWDGSATFENNEIERVTPINFFNRDKTLDQDGPARLNWKALTTGNYGGFDAWLKTGTDGTISIETPVVSEQIAIKDIGFEDMVFDAGKLERKLRLFRLPDENPHLEMSLEQEIALRDDGDNALYVRVTQEDGNQAWSSPIYIFRS